MRVLVAAIVAALAVPAVAGAADWSGVVIAKDVGRQAVVTASTGGKVRTLRAPARFAQLRVGQRIDVRAVARADGTFTPRSIRVAGRAGRAQLRAVLVRYQPKLRRYLVSSGGSVLAIRAVMLRRLASASGEARPGDTIETVVEIAEDGALESTGVTSTGHVESLELEGIFTGVSGATLQLAVVKRGLVSVAVPAGVTLPSLQPGDEIELLVSVGANGAFTLVALDGEDDDGHGIAFDENADEVEVEGTLTSLSPLTVQPRHGAGLSCELPAGMTLTGLRVGARVELECVRAGDRLVVKELELQDDEHGEDEDEHGDEEQEDGDHAGQEDDDDHDDGDDD